MTQKYANTLIMMSTGTSCQFLWHPVGLQISKAHQKSMRQNKERMKAEILRDPINRLQFALLFVCFSLCFLSRSENAQRKFTHAKKKRIEVQRRKKIDNDHLRKSWFSSSCSGGVLLRRSVLLGSRTTVTGMFWTSWLQTSHVRFPLMPNHLNAHSLCANAISPRQLHSIFKISPYSSVSESIHILHTASSSGISPSSCSSSPTFLWHKFSTHHQIVITGLL